MIFGNLNNIDKYKFLSKDIAKCFDYYNAHHGLVDYDVGSYKINGDRLYVNVVSYKTKEESDCIWEAHKQYIDVHIMISGEEQIHLNFVENMQAEKYITANDYLPLSGVANCNVILHSDDFLICYPSDAHETGVNANVPSEIKKAIFKVKVED